MKLALVYPQVWHGSEDYTLASHSAYDSRVAALQSFVTRHSGVTVEIQTPSWRRSPLARVIRPYTLIRELARIRPDVIIVQYPNYPFFWSLDRPKDIERSILFTKLLRSYCDKNNAYLVLDYRDPITAEQLTVREELFHRLEEAVFRSPDAIWSPSSGCLDQIRERFGLDGECLQVVRNGAFDMQVEPAERNNPDLTRFVYTGDLRPKTRGIEQLLDAIGACPDVECEFVICGPNGDWMKERTNDPRVHLLGEVTRQHAASLVRSADIGLLPSPRLECFLYNFPTKLGEFVNAGLAVLCSDADEPASYVRSQQIGIAEPFSEWPDAIRRMVNDKEQLQAYRATSAAMSADLLWENIFDSAFDELQTRVIPILSRQA